MKGETIMRYLDYDEIKERIKTEAENLYDMGKSPSYRKGKIMGMLTAYQEIGFIGNFEVDELMEEMDSYY